MASSVFFTVDEVLDEVAIEEDAETKQRSVRTLDEVIKISADQFSCLRDSIPDYYSFLEEAKKQLLCTYRRYETGVGRMEKVLKSSTPAWPMICSEVLLWLKGIHRRMMVSPRARNPWSIEIKRDLPEQVFLHMRDAIKGSSTAFGVSVQTHELKFTHKTRLLRDLSKFCGVSSSEIRARLQKSFGGNRKGFAAEILVGETKPFIISYDKKKYRITLSCRYGCWNNFGYGFHE